MDLPYDGLNRDSKLELFDRAVNVLSLKPEWIGKFSTDDEFIEKVIGFSKLIYNRFPKDKGGGFQQIPTRN